MAVTCTDFGTKNEQPIQLFTLRNEAGDEACISTLGATLTRWTAPDRHGNRASIVLGYARPEPYLTGDLPYFNSIVGRYANRIARGRFALDGAAQQLSLNEGQNHLHGGKEGFDTKIWEAEADGPDGVVLRYTSPDGEEGYPGTLQATIRYHLGDDNLLTLTCEATTDAPTIVNLTMHGWFNLSGVPGSTVLDHELCIDADLYNPVQADLIPTQPGFAAVEPGSAFDFRKPRRLGDAVGQAAGDGLDHNFCFVRGWAEVFDPESGRMLRLRSDQPGLQVYTGQGLDGSLHAEGGASIPKYGAVVLEPQHFPDSPNHPLFPATVLRPGAVYRHVLRYHATVRP